MKTECSTCKVRVNVGTILFSLFLSLAKGIIGILGSCESLVADGLFSFYQSFVAFKILWDKESVQNKENNNFSLWFAGGVVGAILILTLLDVTIFSFIRIFKASGGMLVRPSPYALYISIISILANQLLFNYSSCNGRKKHGINPETVSPEFQSEVVGNQKLTESLLLSIVISSLVLIGVIFARYVTIYGDAVAALVVVCILAPKAVALFIKNSRVFLTHLQGRAYER